MMAISYQPQCVKSQYMLIKTPTDKASANTMLISTNYIWSQHYKDLSQLMVLYILFLVSTCQYFYCYICPLYKQQADVAFSSGCILLRPLTLDVCPSTLWEWNSLVEWEGTRQMSYGAAQIWAACDHVLWLTTTACLQEMYYDLISVWKIMVINLARFFCTCMDWMTFDLMRPGQNGTHSADHTIHLGELKKYSTFLIYRGHFSPNNSWKTAIARPLRASYGCLLWVRNLAEVLSSYSLHFVKYFVIL